MRSAAVALATTSALIAVVLQSPYPVAAARCDSWPKGGVTKSTYQRVAMKLVAKGKLSRAQARHALCHPRVTARSVARAGRWVSARDVTGSPSADRAGWRTKTSGNLIVSWSILGAVAGTHTSTLSWSYNTQKRRVREWSGRCTGDTTAWGWVNGWSWDGCSTNDFIPYTLNGATYGGIHHDTRGKFDQGWIGFPSISFRNEIWGHYDGTCDSIVGGEYRHAC